MNAEDAILSASTDEYYYFFINGRLQCSESLIFSTEHAETDGNTAVS